MRKPKAPEGPPPRTVASRHSTGIMFIGLFWMIGVAIDAIIFIVTHIENN